MSTASRMPRTFARFLLATSCAAALLGGTTRPRLSAAAAAEQPAGVKWEGKDAKGNALAVPADGVVSVVAFVRRDQDQSATVLEHIASVAADSKAKVVVVLSGASATNAATEPVGGADPAWPVVLDPDFKVSGDLAVHVWPTTVVVSGDGQRVGRLAGLTPTFATDLKTHVDYAGGAIDRAAMEKQLGQHEIVGNTDTQVATRRLQLAQRFVENGNLDQARAQLEQGLQVQPDDAGLQLALARVLILSGDAKAALDVLAKVKPGAAAAWQVAVLKGKALIAQEQWDEAKQTLAGALQLNPQPAEAHYLLGLVHRHAQQWQEAAEQFRLAYEASAGIAAKRP